MTNTSRVAVTGAAGYLGINLLDALRVAGHQVAAIDRRRPPMWPADDVRWVQADVLDGEHLRRELDGVQTVYHLAAVITLDQHNDRAWTVNTDGVESVARAALAAGVRRFVHCSSVHAFDERQPVINESSPRATDPALPVYDRSKWAGEQRLRAVVDDGLDAVVCNPTGVYGARDYGLTRINAILRDAGNGRVPAVIAGGFDFVDVQDVVAGLLAAERHGRTGESYLLGGHRISMLELCRVAARLGGRRGPTLALPLWVMRAIAPAANPIARLFGSDVMSPGAVAGLAAMPTVDTSKAQEELAYSPRPVEETVGALLEFLADTGQTRSRKISRRL